MPQDPDLRNLDLTRASMGDLQAIHNSVLRQIMTMRMANDGGELAAHDNHQSVHSKNSVFENFERRIVEPDVGGP
jgi:hypothetical protein